MIFTLIENFVFFSVLFAVLAYAAAFIVRFAALRNWLRISPFALTRIYAGLIILSPILALWLVLAALLPKTWLGAEVFHAAHFAPVHEPHLLSELTTRFEPFLAYATILFLLIVSFFVVWKSIRGYLRIGRIIRFLEVEEIMPDPKKIALIENIAKRHGMKVGLVLSEQPMTFIWGYWQSRLILTSGIINELSFSELRGVIEHEAAHHTRRDNLVKFLLSAASKLSLAFPLSGRILGWHAEQIELVCDEIAAVRTRKPLEIASALVKVRRKFPSLESSQYLTSGFMTAEVPSIEFRVKRLLELANALPTDGGKPKLQEKPLVEAVSVAFLFITSLAVVVFLAPLGVHEAAESLIRYIK